MRVIVIGIILLACSLGNSAKAQWWNKIAGLEEVTYYGDTIADDPTCAYFIDLPGPPRIGFAGTNAGMWKTTDGGANWNKVPVHGNGWIENICFKDSLIGWFVAWEGGGTVGSSLYRTSDGGNTWTQLPVAGTMDDAIAVSYIPGTNRLFLAVDSLILASTDLGNSWQTALSLDSNATVTGFSFSSDSMGYSAAVSSGVGDSIPSVVYILRTFDGGLTWQTIEPEPDFYTLQPLAIPNSPVCFAGCAYYIWRSNDYGQKWSVISYPDSVENNILNPIQGNLTRLYVQTVHGMLLSTDGGYTWVNDGGPSYNYSGETNLFYSDKGITVAGMTYTDNNDVERAGGLWEEIWPQSGVVEPSTSADSPALRIFPNPASNSITVEPAAKSVTIYDPLGRVYKIPVHGSSLDISLLPAGVYYVSDGSQRAKFVKE